MTACPLQPGRTAAATAGLVLALLTGTGPACATSTVELVAVADATLIEEPTGALANGAGPLLFAGRVGSNADETLRRGLLRFDLGALPPGAVIRSATLRLSLVRSRFAGDLPVSLHRVTASWSEGPTASATGIGDPSVAGDVTWLHRNKPGLPWAVPGGSFVAEASSSLVVPAVTGAKTWPSTAALVADVQAWVNEPASNHGWLLKGFEQPGLTSAKGFATREATNAADRPKLVVVYDPPPPPAPADGSVPLPPWALAALAAGLAGAARPRSRGGRRGQGH